MFKKIMILLVVVLLIGGGMFWKYFYGSATAFSDKNYILFIKTNSTYNDVYDNLKTNNVLKSPGAFNWLAGKMAYTQKVKAGKYVIKNGTGIYDLIRMLRAGAQEPINLTITKLRLPENLAALAGRKLECDSAAMMGFLNNSDSLKNYGLDSNTLMTAIIPNTYTFFWNSTPSKIFSRLYTESKVFWTTERIKKAENRGLTPQKAYIMASIVEEETNATEEKDTIASVYINRMKQNMNLGADPTVKFALRDFGLKRILNTHLQTASPYNTYRQPGLPPGPICTPSPITIDAVLEAPETNYLFFVASKDFNGRHRFANNYAEHLKLAKEYHEALDKLLREKKAVKDGLDK
jgi:UPF0755 protein